ncbi:MAG: peptide chain release factor N(5)-glutamine methyltransferase [Bacteroidales bacterium]|nr:peptide chain release factor N(5)-glutamine methyltransferase [Bacteroidales bacterium]
MQNVGNAWQWFLKSLEETYPEKERHAIAREVFSHFFCLGPAERVLTQDLPFTEELQQTLQWVAGKLKEHVPLQYITGQASFFGLEFKVNENVLIPRSETEELVLWVLDTLKEDLGSLQAKLNLLDVGTGSGCIAVSLASQLLGATVSACDVSTEALKLASENAARNKLEVNFFHCDILHEQPGLRELDVVVSNPPYVMEKEKALMQPNVLEYEPAVALFVSNEDPLLFYRVIARKALAWLKPGGWLFFEINESLGRETKECVEKEGFIHVELKKDINGRDRMIRAKKPRL